MTVADDLDPMIGRGIEPALAVAAITTEQAARLLGIHGDTVRRWIREGRLAAYPERHRGGSVRWKIPMWSILSWQRAACAVVMEAARAGTRLPKKLPK